MSIQAVAPRLDLDGPRPVAPPHSLLATAGVVVDDPGRWLSGVNLDVYPTDVPSLWDPCSAGTFRTKDEGSGMDVPTFDAFTIYVPAQCSTFSLGNLQEMTSAVFDAVQSMGVEEGLAAGVPGMGNPYLGDGNMVALAGGLAVKAWEAIPRLENAIGATGRKGIIHATPAIIAASTNLLIEDVNGGLFTQNRTPVVSGDGYIDLRPTGQVAPGDGEDWAYATGPVEVRLSPVSISDLRSSLDRSDNTVTFRAERNVLATWDAALQVGVLVDWTP